VFFFFGGRSFDREIFVSSKSYSDGEPRTRFLPIQSLGSHENELFSYILCFEHNN
jgi:hypothetical protein